MCTPGKTCCQATEFLRDLELVGVGTLYESGNNKAVLGSLKQIRAACYFFISNMCSVYIIRHIVLIKISYLAAK